MSNLRALVEQHALSRPNAVACIYLRDGEEESGRLTFGQLHSQGLARASWVSRFAQAGDRVLLAYPAGLEFLRAFLGCVYAGLVPVPVELPSRGEAGTEAMRRLEAIAEDCGTRLVLTSKAAEPCVARRAMEWRFSDAAADEPGLDLGANESEIVYLQYTSGSTGEPKRVPVTSTSLATQFAFHARLAKERDVRVFGSWLPHFHDFGLVSFHLSALVLGLPHVFMSPGAFLARPMRWLEMISRYKVGYSGGPNFAYEVCNRSGASSDGMDLGSWRVASVGGEPVVAESLRDFVKQFAGAGFDPEAFLPAYGLAEAGLCVAAARGLKTEWFCREALGRGIPQRAQNDAGIELVAYGEPVGELATEVSGVGEIVVSSDVVGEVRTGDLGFHFEGNLYIAGRLKDLLIVRGRNLDPSDLERTAAETDERLRPGSTAVVQAGEDVVVLQEIDRRFPPEDFGGLGAGIARAVGVRHGVAVNAVVLLRRGTLPRTSSGKLRRQVSRERLTREEFDEVFRWNRVRTAHAAEAREYWLKTVGYQAPRMLVASGAARLKCVSGAVWRASAPCKPGIDLDAALTAMFVLLHRWTGLTRLMVGVASERMLTPVLIDLSDPDVESNMVTVVRRERLAAAKYADYTLSMLAEELQRKTEPSAESRFGAVLQFEREAGWEREPSVPLALTVAEGGVQIVCQAEVFSETDAMRLAAYYGKLLEGMCSQPDVHPLDLPILSRVEQAQLECWSRRVDEDPLVVGGFESWAAREPERTAVSQGGQNLSYGELAGWADALAGRLDGVAAILAGRGFAMVAGLLAALKSSGNPVVLDGAMPAIELRSRLKWNGSGTLLFSKEFEPMARTVCIGLPWEPICLEERAEAANRKSVPARATREIARRIRTLELTSKDVVAQTAQAFLPEIVWQCTAALLVGGRVAVIEETEARDLPGAWVRNGVTIAEEPACIVREVLEWIGFAPSTFVPLPALRWMIGAGEPFAADTCRRWIARYPQSRMLHGLWSADGFSLEQIIEWPPAPSDFRVPLGQPTAKTRVDLLDARGNAVPPGSPGEIFLNGAYTGRRGRFRADGRVEETGLAVTVDGWPFDTAEVEAALRRSPAVKDAAVKVLGEGEAEAVLLAIVVLREQPMTSAGMLRALLRKSLPAAMVPSSVRFVERLPRTDSGAVNWDALPLEPVARRLGELKEAVTATEKRVSAIWRRMLKARPIGVEDDLFELGGDSLAVARIAAEIGTEFGFPMPVSELFRASTIRGVSRYVDGQISTSSALDESFATLTGC